VLLQVAQIKKKAVILKLSMMKLLKMVKMTFKMMKSQLKNWIMEMTKSKLKKRVIMLMLNKKMLVSHKWKRNNLPKMMSKKLKRTKQRVRMLVTKMETMRNSRMFP